MCALVCASVLVYVHACVRKRKKERERNNEKERNCIVRVVGLGQIVSECRCLSFAIIFRIMESGVHIGKVLHHLSV